MKKDEIVTLKNLKPGIWESPDGEILMSGQEWLARFDKEFRVLNFPYTTKSEQKLIKTITIAAYKSAKRAANND